jgi:aminoglycoside phosphotransferase (APT) family kinase protein
VSAGLMADEDWRRLVDAGRLRAWMDRRHLASGPIECVTRLTGGTQNILVRFRRGDREFVLRRPPAHPHLDGSRTMQREARVLSALAGSTVPHPRLIAACDEPEVLGAGFYLMEPVDGFTPVGTLPAPFAASAALRRQMGWAMIDAIVGLANIDPVASGLADFGKLDSYLERQVVRWRGQFDSYRAYAGWPGLAGLPGVEAVDAWLDANRPRDFKPGIVHGDFNLGNVMFHRDRPEIAALIDWELSTLGDPLLDLGWLLASWCDPDGKGILPDRVVSPWPGFPRAEELVARYGERSGRDMSAMPWFCVLACYKMAAINEGTYARALAGKAPMATGEAFHGNVLRLLDRARSWMA